MFLIKVSPFFFVCFLFLFEFLCVSIFALTVSLPWILLVFFLHRAVEKKKLVALLESPQIWHYPLFLLITYKFWPALGILVFI